MHILGSNERYVIHTYVAYIWEQNWQQQRDRETDNYKVQQIVPHLFLRGQLGKSKITVYKVLFDYKLKILFSLFNVDIVLKSVVGMQ